MTTDRNPGSLARDLKELETEVFEITDYTETEDLLVPVCSCGQMSCSCSCSSTCG